MAVGFVSKTPRIVFLAIAGTTALAGAVSGLTMNNYFKTSASTPGKITATLGQKIEINEVCNKLDISYPWVKRGEFSLTVKAKAFDQLVETDTLITFNKAKKEFSFNALAEGEVTLRSIFDSSISYQFNFVSDFSSVDVKNVLKEQFAEFFTDDIVTPEELSSVRNLRIEDYAQFDAKDLTLLPNLTRLSIDGGDKATKMNNFAIPSGTTIYVPKDDYDEYIALPSLHSFEKRIFAEPSSPEKASLMLFKNGGTLIGGNQSSYECVEVSLGEPYPDLPGEDDIYILGNRFKGWKDADGNLYGKKTPISKDTKLYALWEEKTYRVKYNIQDGESAPIIRDYHYNDTLEIIPDTLIPTVDDPQFIFVGWSLSPQGEKVDYSAGQRIENYFNDDSRLEVNLYGVWAYRSFKIEIYNDTVLIKTIDCSYGTNIKVPEEDVIFGIGKYTGLTTVKGSKVIEYEPGEILTLAFDNEGRHGYLFLRRNAGDNKLVFYAVFMPINFKITYLDAKGQQTHIQEYAIDDDTSSGLITNNTPIQFITNEDIAANLIEKEGYHFIGWSRTMMGVTTLFTNKEVKDKTIFDEVVEVSSSWVFNAGFDGKSEVVLTPRYEANSVAITFTSSLPNASKLYNNVTINYDAAGATSFSGSCLKTGYHIEYIQVFNSKLSSKFQISSLEVQGIYKQAFDNMSLDGRHSSIPNNTVNVEAKVVWAIDTFIVSFDSKGGSAVASQTVAYGATVTRPTDPTKAADDNYTYSFAGWFKDNVAYDFTKPVTSSFTLSAKWNATEKPKQDSDCVAKGTLMTLADGNKKPVEELTFEDQLMTWDFYTGQYVSTSICLIEARAKEGYLIDLTFDNGKVLNLVSSHSLFSIDQMKFVKIYPHNASTYLGESFFFVDGEAKLIDVKVSYGYVEYYGIITANYMTSIANDALNSVSQTVDLQNIAPVLDNFTFDLAALQANIEIYGLATYDEFKDLISEEMFNAFNGQLIKVAMGVNGFSEEMLNYLINLYFECGGNL